MLSLDESLESKPVVDGQGAANDQSRDQAALSSIFPLPPMRYIKLYTDQNMKNKCTPPPPKPFSSTNGNFLMFGQTISIDDTIIRTLESQGLRRLYPREYDHKKELKKINASILVNFLDLIDVLIRCPDTTKREEKCNDLQLLFITMHHLINELRPHQARESIRVSLQVQKKQRLETTTRLNKQIERVQEMIKNATESISDYKIDSIIQETSPKNFEKPANTIAIEEPSDQEPTPVSNGHENATQAVNGVAAEGSEESMSELDAFMCDLVDEIF